LRATSSLISFFLFLFFFFNDTATTEIYTLSLHDALPISRRWASSASRCEAPRKRRWYSASALSISLFFGSSATPSMTPRRSAALDRKSTRLNSSHDQISYAVFCLKKKKKKKTLIKLQLST